MNSATVDKIKSLTPVGEEDVHYKGYKMQAPALTGLPLKLLLHIVDTPLFAPIRRNILASNHITDYLTNLHIPEPPLFQPRVHNYPATGEQIHTETVTELDEDPCELVEKLVEMLWETNIEEEDVDDDAAATSSTTTGINAGLPTVMDYHIAYTTGKAAPSHIAESIISAIEESEKMTPPMRFLTAFRPEEIRAAAVASDMRHSMNSALSILDGVPFAVKDMLDIETFPTTSGTAFMGSWHHAASTMPAVKALLDAGAILIGKANTHELGLGTTGLNLITGTPRNPFNINHHTGGSSSGSAALVAAGLCPFAIGTDGGGSIRIPSALCGLVGLKPTAGRVSKGESHPPGDFTVAVAGPIAGCVRDAALVYSVMANRGFNTSSDSNVPPPPPVALPEFKKLRDIATKDNNNLVLENTKIGVYWPWFEDCENTKVLEKCRSAVEYLKSKGATVIDIKIPDLHLLQAAHMCTIASEILNSVSAAADIPEIKAQMNAETRMSLAIAKGFTAAEYINAQKIRCRMDAHFRKLFSQVDWLVTPTTPITAPVVDEKALVYGGSDLVTTTTLMRFMQPVNLLGLPSITVPVGKVDGLPVGLQVMGAPWSEGGLLYIGAVLESFNSSGGSDGGVDNNSSRVRWDVVKGERVW